MFLTSKSEPALLPLTQESRESDETSESEIALDDQYIERKPRSRIRRLCTSNIPWILTTVSLSLYILRFGPTTQREDVPWNPTDVGESPVNEVLRLF
jgi:hypothetical protein